MIPKSFLQSLNKILPESHILTNPSDCKLYSTDNSQRPGTPEVVVFVTTHEQVIEIVRLCNENNIPLVARGLGTGTAGGAIPIRGGLVISFEKMNRILSIDPDNRVIVVEPGVVNQDIQDAAAKIGFFWPPDPSSASYCTVGGNLAHNSSGPRAIKYGTPRENTLGLKVVTGEGSSFKTGVYTTKGVVGYDLTRLIIGSEGTLALITEATLKLTPLPEKICTIQIIYENIHAATKAVSRIMSQPITPCALEFIDSMSIALMRRHSPVDIPLEAAALLIIEVDGLESAMQQSIEAIQKAAEDPSLLKLSVALTEAERQQLWNARKDLSHALRSIAPKKINEDVVVPVSKIAEFVETLEKFSEQYQLTIVSFGHAGNGNLHVNIMIDPESDVQVKSAEKCLSEIFNEVLKLKGTLSGEHGVGTEKRDFIDREIDANALDIMKKIKTIFDPRNLLNPDKIFLLR